MKEKLWYEYLLDEGSTQDVVGGDSGLISGRPEDNGILDVVKPRNSLSWGFSGNTAVFTGDILGDVLSITIGKLKENKFGAMVKPMTYREYGRIVVALHRTGYYNYETFSFISSESKGELRITKQGKLYWFLFGKDQASEPQIDSTKRDEVEASLLTGNLLGGDVEVSLKGLTRLSGDVKTKSMTYSQYVRLTDVLGDIEYGRYETLSGIKPNTKGELRVTGSGRVCWVKNQNQLM